MFCRICRFIFDIAKTITVQNMENAGTNQLGLIEREKLTLSAAFENLAKDINHEDKKQVAETLELSERTVYRYCTGKIEEIRDVTTGKQIVLALRDCIIKREKELKQLSKVA